MSTGSLRWKRFFCALICCTAYTAMLQADEGFDIMHVDSFESVQIVETSVDTTISAGETISADGLDVTATGTNDSNVLIASARDEQGRSGSLLEVTGDSISIDVSALGGAGAVRGTRGASGTCDDPEDPNYPLKHLCATFTSPLVNINIFFPGTLIPIDWVTGARAPADSSQLSESALHIGLIRRYFVWEDSVARLASSCESHAGCSGPPVLLVHGYQKEPFGPILADNGGRVYWGWFPEKLIDDGYQPYEFRWLTNTRFIDAAADLKRAIELISTETGQKVHIVAHSFGGILARRMLQDSGLQSIAPAVASLTTIGTPHSGIFDAETVFTPENPSLPSKKFPEGQDDSIIFEGAGQVSNHLMGENSFGQEIAELLQFSVVPGSVAYELASTGIPDINIQVLIGFIRNSSLGINTVHSGDGLIRGRAQRFLPGLVFTEFGNPEYEPYLDQSGFGSAVVSEIVLGRRFNNDSDLNLEPNGPAFPEDFGSFKHSPGTRRPPTPDIFQFNQPEFPQDCYQTECFFDVYERVREWLVLNSAVGSSFTDCADCPTMVVISAGSFVQGSPLDEPSGSSSERPLRTVDLQAFALGQTEVTLEQWMMCFFEGGCSHAPPGYTVDGYNDIAVSEVSWNDVQQYLSWLSNRTGQNYRLPTESEWEYATRGGTAGRFNTGDCISTEQANYNGGFPVEGCPLGVYRQDVMRVASFAPNAFGLYDTHGNVYEWVQDCWNSGYEQAPVDGSAWLEGDCSKRVLRGGSWHSGAQYLRSGARARTDRSSRGNEYNYRLGFRVARSITR